MSRAERIRGRWRTHWFGEGAATDLAAFRIMVAAHTLWVLLSRDYAGISRVPPVFRSSIPNEVRWRYLILEGSAQIDVIVQWVAVVSLVLVLAGVIPRIACFVAALSIYHLAPLETAMWTTTPYARGMTLAPIALMLLAFSRSGDALSLTRRGTAAQRSWEYRWPLRMIQVLVVQIYLFSAIGKLTEAGLGWGSGDNIRQWLLWFNTTSESSVFTSLGLWIADHPMLCVAIGFGTVLFEWTFALVLFYPRSVAILVSIAVLFQVGTLFSMNIYVGETWYLLVFVNWTSLRSRMGRSLVTPAAASV